MALALNNLKRVDMPLNKETKPKPIVVAFNVELERLGISYFSHYIYMCVCVCITLSNLTGVGNNSVRTIKSFNYEHLNFPGKKFNITDIADQ